MAVKCPKCGGEISSLEKACPKCGASTPRMSAEKPVSAKLKSLSSLVLIIGSILLIIDFFDIAKTYVGTLVLGIGFIISGLAQRQKNKEENLDEKKTLVLMLVLGIFILLCGFVFLYLDLR